MTGLCCRISSGRISPRSPLEGRQLWRIGDWGGASEQIGRQWERLGARCLEALVGVERPGPDGSVYLPMRALILAAEPELAAQVQAHGKSHADAILINLGLGNLEAAKTSITPLGGTCASCHGKYRERMDDGTFRIKTAG